jgi:hypothetical protein
MGGTAQHRRLTRTTLATLATLAHNTSLAQALAAHQLPRPRLTLEFMTVENSRTQLPPRCSQPPAAETTMKNISSPSANATVESLPSPPLQQYDAPLIHPDRQWIYTTRQGIP